MALDVSIIHRHLARLAELAPDDPRWWRPGPKWNAAKLRRFEKTHFVLPADLRTWVIEVGDGGLLLQDDSYNGWKTWGAMLPIAGRKAPELAIAAQPFRIARDCQAKEPVKGVLHIGTHAGSDARYLVCTGKRAGDVWERSVYTDWFYRVGTFASLVDAWIEQSTEVVEAWARARDPAELAAVPAGERFPKLLGAALVPWLRTGADYFVETFRALPRERHHDSYFALESSIAAYADQLAASPPLAGAAAGAMLGVYEERYRPHTEIEHALVAIFDTEQPDLSPANIARLIAALPVGKGRTIEHEIANWPAKWVQMALVEAGRLDEAIALFRVQPWLLAGDWVRLARACEARGRLADAHAALDALVTAPGRPTGERADTYEAARALVDTERFHPSYRSGAAASPFGRPQDFGLIALLYGIAGDGAHMIDAAVRALSVDAVKRDAQEHANQTAHVRIGRALLGTLERTPPIVVDYGANGSRATLARALLARVGDVGVTVRHHR